LNDETKIKVENKNFWLLNMLLTSKRRQYFRFFSVKLTPKKKIKRKSYMYAVFEYQDQDTALEGSNVDSTASAGAIFAINCDSSEAEQCKALCSISRCVSSIVVG
jgi:hypothetical protein